MDCQPDIGKWIRVEGLIICYMFIITAIPVMPYNIMRVHGSYKPHS